MISEKKLAVVFTSLWREITPLAERFVRHQNLQMSRFTLPMSSDVTAGMRGISGELGFRLFCSAKSNNLEPMDLSTDTISELADETVAYIRRFRQFNRVEVQLPDRNAIADAELLAQRLCIFFDSSRGPLLLRPQFAGVGALDACEGDVLAGDTLFEIKSADRTLRVIDIRQLLVYCAINFATRKYEIRNVGIVNPRSGLFFVQPLTEMVREVSGGSVPDILSTIVEFACRQTPSN